MFARTIPLPVKAKLVDEVAAQKLMQRMHEVKLNYRPEQGWLDEPENSVSKQEKKVCVTR